MNEPSIKRWNDLERLKFCQQVQSFVCVQPWRRVTFKFWEMLKNFSKVILVTKNIFFLKILNFVQSFVECKVSLAGGIHTRRAYSREKSSQVISEEYYHSDLSSIAFRITHQNKIFNWRLLICYECAFIYFIQVLPFYFFLCIYSYIFLITHITS